jgi:ligand-binding sensor domain-containing protein/AraC-like DNA-binding protein
MIPGRIFLYSIIFIFSFVAFVQAAPQYIVSTGLPTQKQLPMAQIYKAFHDSEGYMWYATEGGGLCRDDGYSIKTFRSDFETPHLLESNWITCITEDNKHRIWFGTRRGLYILDKKDYSITLLKDKEIERWLIDAILSASDGTIWVITRDLVLHYDTDENKLGAYPVKWDGESRTVTQIYEDNSANIWITLWRKGLFKFDSEKNDFIPYFWSSFADTPSSCFLQSATSNGYWISTHGKGIVYFNPEKEDPEDMFSVLFPFNQSNFSRRYILGMVQDTIRNYLWTITKNNLYAYQITEENKLIPVETTDFFISDKLFLNQIVSDRKGNIWVPSYYPHTFVLSFPKNQVVRYSASQLEKSIGHPVSPTSFVVDNGYYWFCQRHSGLYMCNSKNDVASDISHTPDFQGRTISPILEKSKNNKGIFTVLNGTRVIYFKYENDKLLGIDTIVNLPDNDKVHDLYEDLHSNLWIGTSDNLFRYNLQSHQLDNPVKDTGAINDITVLPDGSVFLATEKQGLCRIQSGKDMESYGETENFVALADAPNQTVWAGTQQGNVYYFDSAKNNILPVTKECGLNGDAILAIEADHSGYIWILTNQRIIIYDPVAKSANTVLDSDPSVSMNNFISLYKDEEGTIYAGGTGGFCAFPAYKGFNDIHQEVSVKLSSIKINENLKLAGYTQEKITLQPDEENVELFFSTLDHLNVENIRYAFRYSDKQESWNYLQRGQNNIYLTRLAKGYYTLEVKATDKNGHWGNNTIKIRIHRLPAWYETSLAYTIYILVLTGIIIMALNYYMEWKKRKQINEQIQNSAKDLQELVCQISGNILTPASTEKIDLKALLIGMRKVLERQKEETIPSTSSDEKLLSASDEKFIQKALKYIEQNINDTDYSVEQLSKDMGMDRTGLYRKLVSIIGKTPTSFIRLTRLNRAARLLDEGYSVSEVADRVGFCTSSYLSKCFQEEFGIKPSQYVSSHKKQKNRSDK